MSPFGCKAGSDRPRCGRCENFDADARRFAAALPGLLALGSADASVRSDDGLCARHDRLVSPRWSCASFCPRATPA